jgi:hypothetical protein
MSDRRTRLTQGFLGLNDDELKEVPVLETTLVQALNTHLDIHHSTTGTVLTALACMTGELITMSGGRSEELETKFIEAYVCTGPMGARTGPDNERSLVRKWKPWRGKTLPS